MIVSKDRSFIFSMMALMALAGLILMLAGMTCMTNVRAQGCPMCPPDYEAYPHEGFLKSLGPEEEETARFSVTAQMMRAKNPAYKKMIGDDNATGNSANNDTNESANTNEPAKKAETSSSARSATHIFAGINDIGRADVVIDVGDGAKEFIDGAIHIPYTKFLNEENEILAPAKIAEILGEAGVSNRDSIVVYGSCLPCGGGPSTSSFVYFVLEYIGHPKARMLDGGIDEWKAAGLSVQPAPSTRTPTTYNLEENRLNTDLLATYSFVKDADVEIIDGRGYIDYGKGFIPGAINIPYDNMLDGDKIKSDAEVAEVFKSIDRTKTVVAYTNAGVKASMLWLGLTMSGYNTVLYTYEDWMKNQPTLRIKLNDTGTRAEPNRTAPGPVKIYAAFEPLEKKENENNSSGSNATGEDDANMTLKTMGCATCEPITLLAGGSLTQNKNPGVKLGSIASAPANFTCTAVVMNSNGGMVSTVPMEQAGEDVYTGVWDASNAAKGYYQVTIKASVAGVSKSFPDALTIAII